jgi:hypothetical protein
MKKKLILEKWKKSQGSFRFITQGRPSMGVSVVMVEKRALLGYNSK